MFFHWSVFITRDAKLPLNLLYYISLPVVGQKNLASVNKIEIHKYLCSYATSINIVLVPQNPGSVLPAAVERRVVSKGGRAAVDPPRRH